MCGLRYPIKTNLVLFQVLTPLCELTIKAVFIDVLLLFLNLNTPRISAGYRRVGKVEKVQGGAKKN